jgi:two-component system response regulator FixJ
MSAAPTSTDEGTDVRKCVYVVDDDPLILDVICSKLVAAGYKVEEYSDAAAFLEAAPTLAHGCIVLDLDMPGMNGLEVQEMLVRMGLTFCIIFYSGRGSVRHAVAGMRAGAADFLQKSSNIQPLIAAIEKGFRR